jgi:serine protease Do
MDLKSIWRGSVSYKGAVLVALISLVVGLGISGSLDWLAPSRAVMGEGGSSDVRSPGQLPDFVSLAKKMRPVVVNISTTQVSEGRGPQEFGNPFGEDDPFNDFWRRFFGAPMPRGPQRQRSLGSGFIIDSDGSILTNNHVVENAQKIVVRLSGDEQDYEAKVVGRDPKTDIAIIKINAKTNLLAATLGDSDRLEVGEWVVAIGNPFGLDGTVTSGIVSAKGRHNITQGAYDNFIQTDASINPGNSGGPLINLRGEVVGINTAIFSRTGVNIGIGFAIPVNLVKELLPQLRGKGKVTRGYLGVLIQKVTPDIAESLGMDKGYGALVANVSKDGPADKAGVKVGDVIVEFDGKEVKDSGDLPIVVARTPVDKKVRMKVLRDKKEVTLTVAVGELKEEEVVAAVPDKGELGMTVQKLTPQIAESLGLDKTEGVVVTVVEPGSAADEAGIRRGDVIVEVDRKPVRSLDEYKKTVAAIRKGKGVLFLVRRGESTLFLALKPQR